jgi:hypothetical protein
MNAAHSNLDFGESLSGRFSLSIINLLSGVAPTPAPVRRSTAGVSIWRSARSYGKLLLVRFTVSRNRLGKAALLIAGRRTEVNAVNSYEMISRHPEVRGNYSAPLIHCIDECFACAQACISCADACMAEPDVEMLRQCIRLNADCADVCNAVGALATRRTGSNEGVLRQAILLCEAACATCAQECERHATRHEHCKICAQHCRACEEACHVAARSVGGALRQTN